MRTILGIDLGTSSVGWALFDGNEAGEPTRLIDLGVRHFEEPVEAKNKVPKSAKRRTARGARRTIRRRRQRLDALMRLLQSAGLAPAGPGAFQERKPGDPDPYELRAKAVEGKAELYEIGRAIYHIGRRRGFKSNRGAKFASLVGDPEVAELLKGPDQDTSDEGSSNAEEAKETAETLKEIANLRAEMFANTLGQFFRNEIRAGRKVRRRRTDRAMYEEEFDLIWREQMRHWPHVLTDELKARIYSAIFWQRPLKLQKFLKGRCSLERKRTVAERAQLVAQRFRYWQDLANLEFTNELTGEKKNLNLEQKQRLAAILEDHARVSWASIRRELGLRDAWHANLERTSKRELKGNRTNALLAKTAPAIWRSLDGTEQERLVEILLTIPDRGTCYKALRKSYDMNPRTAYDLAKLELEPGTASLSAKAMRQMLPFLEQGSSRIEAQRLAGYEPWAEGVIRLERLPSAPSRKEIPNPRVRKGLVELRKVVNALIREYGPIAGVRIELARDMVLNAEAREEVSKANRKRQESNKRADEHLQEIGIANPTRAQKIWYRLGEQCGWICPYSGQSIGQNTDSMAVFEIEHIVPYPRSLDDSFNNLTLCDREWNQRKSNKTPFEAFGATPEWAGMCRRVSNWAAGTGVAHKKKLFEREDLPDEEKMVARQLNDTRWICRAAAGFLRPICDDVQATNGKMTEMVRSHWGLMKSLPGYESHEKTRDDLRHHAIDAVAIAFTSRSMFQRATRSYKAQIADGVRAPKIEPLSDDTLTKKPAWLHAELAAALTKMIVSHEPRRKISGAFHEETALGLRDAANKVYHTRKRLIDMTAGVAGRIADPCLRETALKKLLECGGKAKVAFANGLEMKSKDGKVITIAERARITLTLPKSNLLGAPGAAPAKYFELGSNHHVEIFEDGKGRRKPRFVTTLDAARRVRIQGRALVDTEPDEPGDRFVGWLAPRDVVLVKGDKPGYYVVESLWSNNGVVQLRLHTAGNQKDDFQRLLPTVNTLKGDKVEVDPIGRVRVVPTGVV